MTLRRWESGELPSGSPSTLPGRLPASFTCRASTSSNVREGGGELLADSEPAACGAGGGRRTSAGIPCRSLGQKAWVCHQQCPGPALQSPPPIPFLTTPQSQSQSPGSPPATRGLGSTERLATLSAPSLPLAVGGGVTWLVGADAQRSSPRPRLLASRPGASTGRDAGPDPRSCEEVAGPSLAGLLAASWNPMILGKGAELSARTQPLRSADMDGEPLEVRSWFDRWSLPRGEADTTGLSPRRQSLRSRGQGRRAQVHAAAPTCMSSVSPRARGSPPRGWGRMHGTGRRRVRRLEGTPRSRAGHGGQQILYRDAFVAN